MNRFWIAASVLATIAWASSPPSAFAQCCGGGGHAGGEGHAQHAQPSTTEPQPRQTDRATTQPAKGPQLPLCPVTGEPIDFSFKTMTDDGPVYFASDEAIKKFNGDPEPYGAKVTEQRAALAKLARVQVNCPVTGNPIDGKTFIYTEGQGIYFCCQNCPPKYHPAKYRANLAASYTYQTRCPVDDEKIDAGLYADLPGGQRVYFCCKGCDERFLKDPAKCAANLAAQGINIEAPQSKDAKGTPADPQPGKPNPEHEGHDQGTHGHGGMDHP